VSWAKRMKSQARKTDKKIEDFADYSPVYEQKLELHDPSENHNKFWHVFIYESEGEQIYVVRHWGRNFTKGQSMVELWPPSVWEARSYATEMARKKKREGYTVEVSFLDQLAREL